MVRFAFGDGGHESPVDTGQIWASFGSIRIDAADEVVFLVGHDPRSIITSVIPGACVAVVGGFHRSVIVVAAVSLGVAIIKAAAGVEVQAINHPILSLRLIVNRGAFRVVDADAHARLDKDAIELVAHDRKRGHVRDGDIVKSTQCRAAESAARRLSQVIVMSGLVVDGGDPANCVGAELVLRCRISVSARIRNWRRGGLDNADVRASCHPTGA